MTRPAYTHDQIAADILMSDISKRSKSAWLRAAAKRAQRELDGKLECPECGDEGPHDDNGARCRSELSYCCRKCGTHFDAEEPA